MAARRDFRPDLEGLRAVAVLLVIGFHAGVPGFTGGYVGVDVFFVISGFVITRVLLAEEDACGSVSMRDFYARRARRIVPNVALVVAVTGIAAWVLLPLLAVRQVAEDMISSALFVANWRFIAQGNDYLATGVDHSPLLHLWSLAAEEQFYLVWPVLMVLVAALARRAHRSRDVAVAASVAALSAVSLACAVSCTTSDAPFAYMSTPTRAWQFGAGALLAVVLPHVPRLTGRTGTLLAGSSSWLGLAALVVATVGFTRLTPYPGVAALLPVAGAMAVVVAGHLSTSRASAGAVLGAPATRSIGRLSFAWYLWHWPVLVLAAEVVGTELPWPAALALALVSAVPAYLTLRLVERPLRFSPSLQLRPSAGLSVGVVATVVAVVAGLTVGTSATQALVAQGSDVHPSTAVGRSLSGALLEAAAASASTVGAPWASASTVALGGVAPRLPGASPSGTVPGQARSAGTGPSQSADASTAADVVIAAPAGGSGPLTPSPLHAASDLPQPYACQLQRGQVTGPACQFGTPGGPSVVLFGDSHAQQWQTAFIGLARQRGWFLTVMTKSGCPVAALPADGSGARYAQPDCLAWRAATLTRITEQLHPALVVLASRDNYVASVSVRQAAWAATLSRLTILGVPIVHLRDNPYPGFDVPTCLSGSLADWSRCSFPQSTSLTSDPVQALLSTGRATGVTQLDLTDLICPGTRCPAAWDGVMIYRDDSHLSDTFIKVLAPALAVRLDAAVPSARFLPQPVPSPTSTATSNSSATASSSGGP